MREARVENLGVVQNMGSRVVSDALPEIEVLKPHEVILPRSWHTEVLASGICRQSALPRKPSNI